MLAQGQAPPPDPLGGLIFPLLLGVAFVYFFIIRPQKREQDEKQKLLASIKKNDRVITTGGMYGTIVNIKEDEVTLRVDDQAKVKVRFAKASIARVLGTEAAEEKPSAPDNDKKS
ncbi:MAG: preprotein translocase subunit YajC [Planctomycetes bacterium]|nr:preprotein translocase subunit YajC [Planctomycetota bacterium]MCW8137639.1 preprotein translocase subunit YajC [Planctomycetota bacterium]